MHRPATGFSRFLLPDTGFNRWGFDTNVFVSALLSHNPTSPTRELLQRWRNDEFVLLVSQAILEEVVEKLRERGIEEEQIQNLRTWLCNLPGSCELPGR